MLLDARRNRKFLVGEEVKASKGTILSGMKGMVLKVLVGDGFDDVYVEFNTPVKNTIILNSSMIESTGVVLGILS